MSGLGNLAESKGSFQELHVWIPSNRKYDDGRPKAMDGLNEIIADNRAHKNKGARVERENVMWCAWYILQAMRNQNWAPMNTKDRASPVRIFITFVEVHDRRDVPNVIGGGFEVRARRPIAATRQQGRGRSHLRRFQQVARSAGAHHRHKPAKPRHRANRCQRDKGRAVIHRGGNHITALRPRLAAIQD